MLFISLPIVVGICAVFMSSSTRLILTLIGDPLGICVVLMASSTRLTPTVIGDPPALGLQSKQPWPVRMGGGRQIMYCLEDYW